MCIFVYHCFYFVYLAAALRALTEPCMSRSPIVHCNFMLHFYERINDDDDDDDDENPVSRSRACGGAGSPRSGERAKSAGQSSLTPNNISLI